jgi:hypothetical protein
MTSSLEPQFDLIKQYLFGEVETFCKTHQAILTKETLLEHINSTYEQFERSISSKPKRKLKLKLKLKPKDTKSDIQNIIQSINTLSVENDKPKVKPKKLKVKVNTNAYNDFVEICKTKQLEYFQFYDENNWIGPAINIPLDEHDNVKSYFSKIKLKIISGTNFYLLHPKVSLKDTIVYPDGVVESCKLEQTSLIAGNSDSEAESVSIYDAVTDAESDEGEIVELDEWVFSGVKYLIDLETNTVYSFQTNEPIGKKIDEFNIDFDLD